MQARDYVQCPKSAGFLKDLSLCVLGGRGFVVERPWCTRLCLEYVMAELFDRSGCWVIRVSGGALLSKMFWVFVVLFYPTVLGL